MQAQDIIKLLQLEPHPEGGYYRQTWIAPGTLSEPAGTAIYFLLTEDRSSHWHRIESTELWHFYAGAPVELRLAETDQGPATRHVLGPNLTSGERPQEIVPPRHWQAARTLGDWSLVGCTVSPAFSFDQFELAAPDFDIPD